MAELVPALDGLTALQVPILYNNGLTGSKLGARDGVRTVSTQAAADCQQ